MAKLMVAFVAAALLVALVSATGQINDYCVADPIQPLLFNGLVCKKSVKSEDFAFRGFRADADTKNPLGIGIIPGFAGVNYFALNTFNFALAKFNYAKAGLVPPHTHPRASEVIMVTKGQVLVGFVDTAGTLFFVTLKTGDFFLFPQGLVHFQFNTGSGHAESVSVLDHQNPGVQLLPGALYGSNPPIDTNILSKAFGTSDAVTDMIKKGFQPAM